MDNVADANEGRDGMTLEIKILPLPNSNGLLGGWVSG